MLLGVPPVWTYNHNAVGENSDINLHIRKYLANGKLFSNSHY